MESDRPVQAVTVPPELFRIPEGAWSPTPSAWQLRPTQDGRGCLFQLRTVDAMVTVGWSRQEMEQVGQALLDNAARLLPDGLHLAQVVPPMDARPR